MNIEKIDVRAESRPISHWDACKKINEIIDSLKPYLVMVDIHRNKIFELEERLSALEQCPINDARQCQPPTPEYDPDEVKFTDDKIKSHHEWNLIYKPKIKHEIAKEGTFEWALMQVKNGKSIRRKGCSSLHWLAANKIMMKTIREEGCWGVVGVKIEDILATDWEIVG